MHRSATALLLAAFVTACGGDGTTGPRATVGTLLVRVSTTGLELDPNGYAIGPSEDSIVSLPVNGSATIDLAVGSRIVTLTGQAPNCVPEGDIMHSVTIAPPDTTVLDLSVVCFRDPIVFNRWIFSAGDENLWVVDASGGPVVDLTAYIGHSAWLDGQGASLSPDRTKIVFSSDRLRSISTVFVMALNKSFAIPVAADGLQAQGAWSPDGQKIVYLSWDGGPNGGDLWVANANATSPHGIVTSPWWDGNPVWSPDGSKIAFQRDTSAGDHPCGYLVVANADGSGEVTITDGLPSGGYAWAVDAEPQWSPDGSRIVFEREEIDAAYTTAMTNLWMVDPDGQNLVQITHTPSIQDQHARWRDDGSGLVWSGCTAGCYLPFGGIGGATAGDVWWMNADGGGIMNVTNTGIDAQPNWNATTTFGGETPAAMFLVISRVESNVSHLYRIDADGSRPIQLTTGTMHDVDPEWR
jgi:Tol biopolymer transport system component